MSDVYAPPQANLETDYNTDTDYPGLRRLPYFLYSAGVNIVYAIALFAIGTAAGAESAGAIGTVLIIAVLIASMVLVIKRLQNLGSSGWWAIGMFVPLLNFWIGIKTMAFPEGYDDHRTLDTAAKIIIGLFLGSMILGIGVAILLTS